MKAADLKLIFSDRLCLMLAKEVRKIREVIPSKLSRLLNPRRASILDYFKREIFS
jgi:hypothetical protein